MCTNTLLLFMQIRSFSSYISVSRKKKKSKSRGNSVKLILKKKLEASQCLMQLFYRLLLKGQCRKFFDLWFFHESVSPKPLSTTITSSDFFNSRRYSQLKVHQCCAFHLQCITNHKSSDALLSDTNLDFRMCTNTLTVALHADSIILHEYLGKQKEEEIEIYVFTREFGVADS